MYDTQDPEKVKVSDGESSPRKLNTIEVDLIKPIEKTKEELPAKKAFKFPKRVSCNFVTKIRSSKSGQMRHASQESIYQGTKRSSDVNIYQTTNISN